MACDDRGQRRPRRPAGQGRRRRRPARRGHGHLPVDARRVRGGHRRAVRRRPRARRAGLRRRRQPQRARRRGPAGPLRRRRQPPQPAQDVLHPPRRRRPGRRSRRRAGPPRAVPARPPAGPSPAGRRRSGRGGAVRVGRHPAHLLGLHRADGRRRAAARRPQVAVLNANYVAAPPRDALPRALHRPQRAGRPRVHPRPAPDHEGHRRHRRRRGQAADGLRLPRADDELPRGRDADGRADRERGPRASSTASATP